MGVGSSREGEVLKGKYRLESLLGSGGMGEVYRARNTLVDRDVAIKILHKRHIENAEVVGRFMREAKAANAVRHRNIVDVLDIDTLDDGVPFIVQEYLEGSDLSKRLEKPPHQLPPGEALTLLLPVIEAVGEAHKRGIVHRDLKPENIYLALIDGETVPKILDFGISKVPLEEEAKRRTLSGGGSGGIADESTHERLTMMGAGLGTPYYMSPEQIRDPRTVDARTDVWSIGVMFYEALTGRMPFDAEDLAGLFAQIQTVDPVDVRRLVPGCPPELARIIHRCLSPNREARHDDAATLARALRQHRTKSQAPDAIETGAAPASVPPAAAVPDLGLAATQLDTPSGSTDTDAPSARSVPDLGGLELELPTKSKPPKKRKRPPRTSKPAPEEEDDDPFALGGMGDGPALELAVDVPASGSHRPRVARTAGSGAPASSSRPPSSRDGRGIQVRRRSDKGPAVVGPLLVMGLAGGIVVGGYFVQPRLTPEAVLATQHELGGARAAVLYLGVTGIAALGTLWIAAAGIRRVAYALLVATLGMIATLLGGIAASGIVAAPGLLPSVLSKIGFLAGTWGTVGAALGLGLFAIGRGRELRDDVEIGWMGNLFLAAGVVAVAAGGWMGAMGPKVSVADASQAGAASTEQASVAQAERFCITVAGGQALSQARDGAAADASVVAAARAAGELKKPEP